MAIKRDAPIMLVINSESIKQALEMMAEGNTLKHCCAELELNYMAVWKTIHADDELLELYARAREAYAHSKVQQIHDVALSEPDVQRARLICDNIKWEACKVLPKVYGDKVETKHSGDIGLTVNVVKFSDNDSE